jgi:hypothetical protein
MARLILHLGQQDRLALQRRRAGDPVALRQLAHDLGMGVLADLADQRLAVALGHPVLGLDLLARVDAVLEPRLVLGHLGPGLHPLAGRLHHLCVHARPPLGQTRSITMAVPCPTPTHIVQSAYRPPVRRN